MEIFGKILAVLFIVALIVYATFSIVKFVKDIKDRKRQKTKDTDNNASEPIDHGSDVNNEEVNDYESDDASD